MRAGSIVVVAVLGFGLGALAQRTVTYQPPASVQLVEVRRLPDGGAELTVYARAESDAGHAIDTARTCDLGDLTAAQRTAVGTLRTAALACWRSAEGL